MSSTDQTTTDNATLSTAELSAAAPRPRFDVSVVIPVYFNEATVASVVDEVWQAWTHSGRSADALEFVLVDDGSQDNSWQVLQTLHQRHEHQVVALRLARNHGSQLAILAGASVARGARIAVVAADGQEPADLVARMAEATENGQSLALATRKSRADGMGTRAGANFFYRLVRWLGLHSMPPQGFDAFLMDREMMQTILDIRDPNIPLSVTIAWLGHPYECVEYDRLSRLEGKSRWTLKKKIKLAVDAITAVSYTPIRAISLFGIFVALSGFAYALLVLFIRLSGGTPVQGWTSLLITILVIGGTQLFALGIIGEYLWRTLEIARRRPLWTVAETKSDVPVRTSTSSAPKNLL